MKTFKPTSALWEAVKENKGQLTVITIGNLIFLLCYVLSGSLFGLLLEDYKPKYAFALAFLFVGIVLTSTMQDVIQIKLIPNVAQRINENFMTSIMNRYETEKSTPDTGKLIAIFTDLSFFSIHLIQFVREAVIPCVLSALIGIGVLFWVHPSLGLIMGLGTVVLTIAYVFGLFYLQKDGVQAEKCHLNQEDNQADVLLNLHNIFAVNMTEKHLHYFRNDLNNCYDLDRTYLHRTATVRSVLLLILSTVFVGILYMVIKLVRTKTIAMTSVAIVVFVLAFLRENLFFLVDRIGKLSNLLSYMEQVNIDVKDILQGANECSDNKITVRPTDSTIVLQNVIVLNRIYLPNLTLLPGDRLILRGEIGSGKSTLLNILFGKLPYEGSVTIGNQEVREMDVKVLREIIMLIPQSVTLFKKTVYFNVAYGNNATREEVQALFEKFNVTFAQLDDEVGHLGERFSGGQRQILFLLRALLRANENTKIILLDEPTSALDPNTRALAFKIIEEIIKKRTAVIVTHDATLEDLGTAVVHLNSITE